MTDGLTGTGRDSRRGRRSYSAAPDLTSGEFQNQYETFISSRNSWGETHSPAEIYATTVTLNPHPQALLLRNQL